MILSSGAGRLTGAQGAVVGVGLNIYAINNFSGPAAQAQKSLKAIENEFRRTMSENLRTARDTYGAMAMAGGLVTKGIYQNYKAYADFQYVIKGTQIVAKASSEEYNKLYREALKLGETTMFRSQDIAVSMREMAKSGMGPEAIINNIRAAVAGAGASMESLEISTRSMIATMNQFQIPSSGAMHTMDRLVAAALGARTTIEGLTEALKMSAADFYSLNIPLETALGMLMQMGNFGIDNTMAGTAVGNFLRYLSTGVSSTFATGRQVKALGLLGLDPSDFKQANGELKEMVDIFKLLNSRYQTLSTTDRNAAFAGLFGIRGRRAAAPMAMDFNQLANNIKLVANSSGIASENLAKMMDTPKGGIDMLISAWDSFKIAFGDAVGPLFTPIIAGLKNITTLLTYLSGGSGGILQIMAKAVFSLAAGFIMVKTVVWAAKAAFSGFAMLFVSNRVSFDNMKKAMSMGWDVLKLKAFGYRSELTKVMTTHAMLEARTKKAMMRGMTMNQAGHMVPSAGTRVYYQGKVYKGGQPLPKNMTGRHVIFGGGTPSQAARRNNFIARSRGAGAAAATAKNASKGLLGRFALGGVFTKLGAALTGPWGMALMTIAFVLPGLIQAIKGNTSATKEATLKRNLEVKKRYDEQFFDMNKIVERHVRQRMLEHYMETGQGTQETKRLFDQATINVNIDGKRVFEDKITQPQLKTIRSLGE